MQNKKFKISLALCLALLVITAVFSLFSGSAGLTPSQTLDAIMLKDNLYSAIIYSIRLPRILGAILAGAGLSVSGVILQAITSNELCAPNIIGVNSGAGFFVIMLLFFFPELSGLSPVFAFVGAVLASLVIVFISQRVSGTRGSVILVGVALTAILNAGISMISLLDSDVLSVYNYFSVGGLANVSLDELYLPGIFILLAFILAVLFSNKINTLTLGDEIAASLGTNVKMMRIISVTIASLSASAAVSFAGLLGFVGLVVPNVARKLIGAETRKTVILSAVMGSLLVLLADTLGRIIFSPTELSVGITMALIGAPFFLYLIVRRKNLA